MPLAYQSACWVLLGAPLVVLEWSFYVRGYNRKDPQEWDKQANSGRKDKKVLDTTLAHLNQFLSMLGIYIGYAAVFPYVITATLEPPLSQTAALLRFCVGITVLLIPYIALDILGQKKNLLVASTIRVVRYACLPPVAAILLPALFTGLRL